VDSGHEAFDDGELHAESIQLVMWDKNKTDVVVHDLCERCEAVGRAGGIGDDLVFGLVGVEVDAANEPGPNIRSQIFRPSEQLTLGHRMKEQR